MSIFRNVRRITELTIQRKLFTTPPRIFHGIVNKDKSLSKKLPEIDKNLLKYKATGNNRYSLAKNISQHRIASKRELLKPRFYDITPHNHVDAQSKVLSNELRPNRNQIIYHRVFTTPDVKQQQTFFKPSINVNWFAKKRDEKGGAVKQSGERFGKVSSANEAGFFHKTDREILMELKKKLKDSQKPDAPKKS